MTFSWKAIQFVSSQSMLDSGLQKGLNVTAFNDVKWDKKKRRQNSKCISGVTFSL